MGLFNTSFVKFSPDLAYMTTAEGETLRRLSGQGVTFFRIRICESPGCSGEVIKSGIKRFCSKKCYEEGEGNGD